MKNNYFKSLIFGILCLTINMSQSQNLLFDGDFSVTTEIIFFDTPTPPVNTWAFWVNYWENGSEANPTVVGGVCNFQIINPGINFWDVQLAQWGFPLILGNSYQLLFDVKAEKDRLFGLFLGEDAGNYTNLIGYERYYHSATTEWQTMSIDFVATSVFALHKLSFELGTNNSTIYFDNVILRDLGPAPPAKVVIAGTFQSALNCANDWDPNCNYTELTLNSTTGLYTGTFQIPEGSHRYKVTVGGSWDINYGENGIMDGADIFLCVPSVSEEITFTYDPLTHLVSTSPLTSGFSPDCLPMVVIAGTFQDELGCDSYWVPDCTNTALIYNSESGLFEGNFNIPAGCYYYRVVLDSNWQNSFGQEGMHNGLNYIISIPANPGVTHFTYDPVSHIVSSTPYSGAPQEVTQVSLVGTFQDESGCAYDFDYECPYPALLFNPESSAWEGSFILPAGCYIYVVKETFGCDNVSFFGENGIEWGDYLQLYVPSDGEIAFSYDPQTHIIRSTPYSGAPQEVTQVSLYGTFQDELGCAYDYENECDKPALVFNADSGVWEGSFTLPAGCYSYRVKETFGCIATLYGENGIEGAAEIQLYVPSDGEITFSYDPQTHIMSSTPYNGVPQELTKVSLIGNLQDELGCTYDYDYECDNPELVFNSHLGTWEGRFTLPSGCYTYLVKETTACNVIIYGENGYEGGTEIQLYIPSEGEITFSYDPQTHIMSSTPYSGVPQELTEVSLIGTLQNESGCAVDFDFECDKPELLFNPYSGAWEGSITLPAGCYIYWVKEKSICNATFYGENGIELGVGIQLYVPADAEITFSYDPQTHILSSTPYSEAPQEVTKVSLIGTLQDELGCAADFEFECDSPALLFNSSSGAWEGSFTLPAGCYIYWVKETFGCNNITFYGENGNSWGNGISLYVPTATEITFSYDPLTHIISTTPYTDISTVNQCPDDIYVNNSPGLCGAIVTYPEFVATGNCGGEIISVTQTRGLPSGSFFTVGTTTNTFLLTKISGEELTCSFDVVVNDTESPVISGLSQSHVTLSPPNHKMVPIFIGYSVNDNCSIAGTVLSISSNEPVNGLGDGNTIPDWEILDEHNILLRAERSGKGNGREYYITIKVTDSSGNFTEQLVTVKVPHDKGQKSPSVESDISNNKYILYPNAADDLVNLKGPKTTSNSSYVIYDLLGIMRKRGIINNDQIEVSTLIQGIYILKFETDEGSVFKKFIKN